MHDIKSIASVNSLTSLSPLICFSSFSWASRNSSSTCFSIFYMQLTNILTQSPDFKLFPNTSPGDAGVLVLVLLSSRGLLESLLLHEYFLFFLNCTSGTKSHNTSKMILATRSSAILLQKQILVFQYCPKSNFGSMVIRHIHSPDVTHCCTKRLQEVP